jgi:hypothetical protein
MSLQAPCQVFVNRFPQLGQPVDYSIGDDIHTDLIYLTWKTSLESDISISFQIIVIDFNFRDFKFGMEFNRCSRQ